MQLQKELTDAEANTREQLQDSESRFAQTVSELREAAEEANVAAETASQNVEHWRRRYTSCLSLFCPESLEPYFKGSSGSIDIL